jgi:predicted transposase/invertase (TIGR01784 family)
MNLKTYRDFKSTVDTAFDEGKLEGIIEGEIKGKLETAKSLKLLGIDSDIISKSTGLTKEEIEKL